MPKTNLLRKVKIDGKWRMLPVAKVQEKSGVRHDLTRVVFAGKPAVTTGGTFYLEYRDPGRVRRAIGDHPRDVKAAVATQTSVLALRKKGVAADDAPELRARVTPAGPTIAKVVADFSAARSLEYRHKSFLKYRNAVETFESWAAAMRKTHVSQIGRLDVKAFMAALVREQGWTRRRRSAKA